MYVSDNIRFMITAAQAVDMMIRGYVCVQGRSQKGCVLLFGNSMPRVICQELALVADCSISHEDREV